MSPSPLETNHEKRLRARVQYRLGGWCIKLNPVWYVGIPDRLVLLPGGRVVFVELKRKRLDPSTQQGRVHAFLRDLGFEVLVLDSREAVDAFIEKC